MKKGKILVIIFCLLLLLIPVFVLSISIGPVRIPWTKTIGLLIDPSMDSAAYFIIMHIRLPRFLIAFLAGWGLSMSGAVFQGILRNPLADSYVLGVASGAAFGAVLSILSGLHGLFFGVPILSFAGAIISILLVYYIGRVDSKLNTGRMILAGVIVGTFFSAAVSLLLSISSSTELKGLVFWLLGDLSTQDMQVSMALLPYVILASLPLIFFAHQLNILGLGEEGAEQLGLNVKTALTLFFVFASLLTAAVVSTCGVIGFVGLIIPHILRLMFGPDHRILVLVSGLAGGIFLVICDLVARSIISPSELPVGVITAFSGAPFFLYLLKWRRT